MKLPSRTRLRVLARREARRFLLVFLVAVGVACGLTAVVFHATLEAAHELLIGGALSLPRGPWRWAAVLLLPTAMGSLLAALVPRLAPQASGGLALVRAAYAVDPRRLDLRAWLGTFLATPLSLGSGIPLGPEGPTVVLTSGVATGLARVLGLPHRVVRGMIPVGTAAGIAAIFNTPITGVVFALEEVIGTVSRGVLGGAIVAAVAAAVVQKQAMGGEHLLPAAPAAWGSAVELVGFAWLGITAGAAAGYLPRFVERARERLRRVASERGSAALAVRGAGAGLVVGLLGLLAPESLGVGYDSISGWLAGGGDAGTASLAFLAKFLGMGVALGAGLAGGVFAPSLFLGASLGAAFGHSVGPLWPALGIDPGAYALVGMGAFFAGFLRTPLAAVLIVFELTGDYNLVAPLMLAVALATLIAPRLSPATLVESALEERGVLSTEAGDPFALVRAREVMSREIVALPAHATLAEALQEARRSGHAAFPVIDGEGLCIGMLDNDELERAVAEGHGGATVLERRHPVRVLATADEPLDRVALRLGAAGETRCPVVASLGEPRLVGFLTPMDFLRARLIAARDDKGDSGFQPLGA